MPKHDLIDKAIPPKHFVAESFKALVDAPADQVALAIQWISSAPAVRLSLSDCKNDFSDFVSQQGAEVPHAEKILGALFSLEGIRAAIDWTGDQFSEFLVDEAVKEQDVDTTAIAGAKDALRRFFSEASGKLAQTHKAQRVYDGLLANFQSCSSLVEFRPIYDETRTKILSGIVAATLTVEIMSPKPDAALEYFSVQLDAADIDQLLEELKRLKSKLGALKQFAEDNTVLLNPSRSLPSENE